MRLMTRSLRLSTALAIIASTATALAATNNFIAPAFRGEANSQAGYWETFSAAFGAPGNPADQPSSTTGALLTQIGSPSAFLTGSGNIYDPVGVPSFELADSTPFELGAVVLQTRTLGSELDYSGVRLTYDSGAGVQTVAPLFRVELDRGADLGASVSSLFQWDLSGLGVTEYSIFFEAADASLSLDSVTLDAWDQFMAVPEPSAPALFIMASVALCLFRKRRA